MTRPIDETWTADGGCIDVDEPYQSHVGQFGFGGIGPYDEARARLAAQAPAMARLLLRLQDERLADSILQPGGPDVIAFASDAEDLLRAAGVVE